MIFAFLAPSIIDQYAQQAVTFEPTSLSIHSFTSTGVKARVQGDFSMDANKVKQQSVRDIGRFGTWIAQKAQSGESEVEVTLPEYDIVLGTAHVPPIVVNLRAGEITHVDFITELQPGEFDGLRRLASDWIEGRLGQLRVLGKADVPIKSGIFSFGTQKVVHELLFANKDIPTIPAYKIQKLNIHEVKRPTGANLEAEVSLKVENPYPVALTVPPVGFSVLVDNCQPTDPYIIVADALSKEIDVHPKDNVEVNVTGYVRKLPDILTQACPGTNSSPLDLLLGNYIKGKETTVYVKGAQTRYHDTPKWIADILSSINVPVPLPGKSFGHLIKNFSMTDTKFSLPSPIAEPGTPEAQPRISANLKAIIAIPEEMNFNLDVSKIRSNATVYYKKKELGTIDLRQWHAANSTRLPPKKDDGPSLLVESALQDVPLNITNDDVLSDVISAIIWGKTSVMAEIKADVDVGVATPLGDFVVRNIPASGTVPVKPINDSPTKPGHGHDLPSDLVQRLQPRIYDLSVVSSTPSSITISALVNIINPTLYEASIPYLSLHALTNESIIATAKVENLSLHKGNNTALRATATWSPSTLGGGEKALKAGIEFLSQYISGYNTSITVRFHEDSVPSNPALSRALSRFNMTVPTPRLPPVHEPEPGDDPADEVGGPKFIEEARFHLFSSTADFILRSPLRRDTLVITNINATAFYEGHRVGQIDNDEPFEVEPVDEDGQGSLTPRLPVVWETGGVGWDAVRKALGGRLKVNAQAIIGIRLGMWTLDGVWFHGRGLGIGVRP
ncbi:hypothetical protein MRB53_039762 [Persea americana]|nr:hypothetical protein MRB53_039762 [Persea americana]